RHPHATRIRQRIIRQVDRTHHVCAICLTTPTEELPVPTRPSGIRRISLTVSGTWRFHPPHVEPRRRLAEEDAQPGVAELSGEHGLHAVRVTRARRQPLDE